MPNPILTDFHCMSCGHHFTSTTRCEHGPLLARIKELEAAILAIAPYVKEKYGMDEDAVRLVELAAARAGGWQPGGAA